MNREAFHYNDQQVDLACLDTITGDMSEYRACLRFSWSSSAVATIGLLFEVNGAMPFSCDPAEEYAYLSNEGTLRFLAEAA